MGTYNPYDCQRKIIKEKDKEIALYKTACERMVHVSANKDLEISTLTTDRDYWKAEALKWCSKLGEIRMLAGGGGE